MTTELAKTNDETDHNDPMNSNRDSWMTTADGLGADQEEGHNDFGVGHRLRHIDSGEIGWWENDDDEDEDKNDNDDTLADDLTMNLTEDGDHVDLRHVQRTPPIAAVPDKVYRIKRIESGEKAWWMDDSPSKEPSPVVRLSNAPFNNGSPKTKLKLSHVPSGDRAWWLSDSNDERSSSEKPIEAKEQIPNKTEIPPARTNRGASTERAAWWLGSDSDSGKATSEATTAANVMNKSYTISRSTMLDNNECDERTNKQRNGITEKSGSPPLNSNENSADANDATATSGYRNRFNAIRHVESGEKAWWLQDDSDAGATTTINQSASDSTTPPSAQSIAAIARDIGAIASNADNNNTTTPHAIAIATSSVDYDELGDRASPEGLEDTSTTANGRQSPYDNVNAKSVAVAANNKKLFISRHTNIDDLLGGSCHPLSPLLMDRFSSASPPRGDAASEAYQEISAAQVRIHDSTAQMPEIRRMHADG